ncbi:class I SAM-dependent methyltransferase [Streptomyces sp. B1866]|uniref:class I SAM-dependent methyltransferase n=1 Tax=Streptomyces sp. B1866 TaxID=3075431 RepID=UPI0028900303|nr:class I SAM-dependent methyltransferase [Streptomyces sp. B1866]MDT3396315.1 class I SAM-dependent methyltransferase [Streptomyces sp. B1866]
MTTLLYPDPGSIFTGTASHYLARPGYPAELLDRVAELARRLPGSRVLDLGTGPGVVALELAQRGAHVVAVDPSLEMLAEGKRRAAARFLTDIEWVEGHSGALPPLVGDFAVVVIADAFHLMRRQETLATLDGLVHPDGCVVLLSHRWPGHPKPSWDPLLERVRARHLGPRRHAGPTGYAPRPEAASHEEVFRNSAFHRITKTTYDYMIDVTLDGLIAWQLSQAHSSAPVLGERRAAYEEDLRRLLSAFEPSGRFRERSQAHLLIGQRSQPPTPRAEG